MTESSIYKRKSLKLVSREDTKKEKHGTHQRIIARIIMQKKFQLSFELG